MAIGKAKTPLEKVEEFKNEDWKRIERRLHSNLHWYVTLIGFFVFFAGIGLLTTYQVSYDMGNAIAFSGGGIAILGAYFASRVQRDENLVKSLIEKEFEKGMRILPDWFKTKHGFWSRMPFRKAPGFTDEEWQRLVLASKMRDELRQLIVSIPFILLMLAAYVLPTMLNLPWYFGIIAILVVATGFFCYLMVNMRRAEILTSVEKYEELSGQRAIPDVYRSQIVKSRWVGRRK